MKLKPRSSGKNTGSGLFHFESQDMPEPSFFDPSETQVGEARVMLRQTSQGQVDVIIFASFESAAEAEAWVDAILPEPAYH
jgi:hypothetical protein